MIQKGGIKNMQRIANHTHQTYWEARKRRRRKNTLQNEQQLSEHDKCMHTVILRDLSIHPLEAKTYNNNINNNSCTRKNK